jgi:hypothetical protein
MLENNHNQKSIDLTLDSLKEVACRTARLHEWGDEDFHVPLAQLIQCFKDKYSPTKDKMMCLYFQNALRTILVNRLYIQDNYNSHPEILHVPLQRPLFIVGIARTGSTLFHRLISQELSCRVLLYWEMNHPFIGPNLGLNHEKLSIKLAELKIKEIYARLPDLFHIHEIKATEPEECNILMRHTFCSLYLASEWNLPRYAQWLVNHDMTASYRYYRKLLQLLLWHKPGDFLVLKCPSHLLHLNTILDVFPDANIVWLHRNPVKTIPSYLDLLSVFWGSELNNETFIQFIFDYTLRSLDMGMQTEKKLRAAQFLNLSYKELVKDPTAAILKIYNYFNYKISGDMESNMRKWLKENPQHKHGVHRYSLEKFALSEAEIKERLSRYYNEYGDFL